MSSRRPGRWSTIDAFFGYDGSALTVISVSGSFSGAIWQGLWDATDDDLQRCMHDGSFKGRREER